MYNDAEQVIFAPGITNDCLKAFQLELNCGPKLLHLVTYTMQSTNWTTSMLQGLCSTGCNQSVHDLGQAIAGACGAEAFWFHDANMTMVEFMEYVQYKYGLICLADATTGEFCVDVESKWNISSLISINQATWPNHTEKEHITIAYGGWTYGGWEDLWEWLDDDADPLPPETNYCQPDIWEHTNYGWPLPLAFDEYPLEIQCSSCFLQKFIYGIESKWGNDWDELSEQMWSNMMHNCGLSYIPIPANNITGPPATFEADLAPQNNTCSFCPRVLRADINSSTCLDFAVRNGVSTAALRALNGNIYCSYLSDNTYCAPEACAVTVVMNYTDTHQFVDGYDNITYQQFMSWNPFIEIPADLRPGEVVCVQPSGGIFNPGSSIPEHPPTFVKRATNALPTPLGTTLDCGRYYEIQPKDVCALLSMRFGITFARMREMNPSINADCTNLLVGHEYCVASVSRNPE